MLSQFLKWGGPACLGKWAGMEVLSYEKEKKNIIKTKLEIKSMNKKKIKEQAEIFYNTLIFLI